MTKEEMLEKLRELRSNAENSAKAYNDADHAGNSADKAAALKKLDEAIAEYSSIARTIVFQECKESENPMIEAVKRLTYPTIAGKLEKVEDTEIQRMVIEDREKQIDLLKLHKYVDGGIGADHNWVYMVEKFNMLLTARRADELGIDPKTVNDSYAMSEIAREFDLGKNPASNTKILDTLRTIVGAMIGEEYKPKVTSHDVAFLLAIYSRKARKALTVSCANHKFMRGYVMEICHRVVLDKAYAVEFKQAK